MSDLKEEEIGKVLRGLVGIFKEEETQKAESLAELLDIPNLDLSKFLSMHKRLQHDLDDVYRAFLVKSGTANVDEFLFCLKNEDFIKRNMRLHISRNEGYACSEDKVRFIFRGLLDWFKTGEEYELDYTQEYIFHYPSLICLTHPELLDFYEMIKSNYYCNDDYLKRLLVFTVKISRQQKKYPLFEILNDAIYKSRDLMILNLKILKKSIKFDLHDSDGEKIDSYKITKDDFPKLEEYLEHYSKNPVANGKYIIQQIILKFTRTK